MTFRRALSLCTSLLLASSAAMAQRPVIDISNPKVQAYPIALAPPQGDPAAQEILSVVQADFERSGLFKVLDPRSFLASPQEGVDEKSIDFSKWASVGAQGLVKAVFQAQGDRIAGEFHVFDVPRSREVLKKTYALPRSQQRQIAHRFADDVVKLFTQEPGAFATRIAYVRETANGKQIVVADSDGFGPQQLTGASINLLPTWTPDGRGLAFTTFREGNGAHIYWVDATTKALRPLVMIGDFATGAAFSPDGSRLLFTSSHEENTDIYTAKPDGSGAKRLTDSRGIDVSPSFSPDGKQVAFVSDRAGSPQIYLMNADGSGLRRLTFQGNFNQEPAWSPKGDLIAFTGRDEKRSFDVYTVNAQSGKIARLTQNEGTNEKPSWAPNGQLVLFSSTRTGKRQLWTASPDGSNPQKLTDEPMGAFDPAWGPFPK
ncbi:MAG: Tol-Pal system beta propeller repeat protein TolB [Myxococcales bacterium]